MSLKSVYIFRVFIMILFMVLFKNTFSQFGNIRLNIEQVEYNDSIPFEVRLYSVDSLLIYKCNVFYQESINIDSVKHGSFYLKIFRLGVQGITIHDIIVKADCITTLGVDFSSIEHQYRSILNGKKKLQVNAGSGVPNFAFTIQTYQPGFSSQKETVNSIYSFGFRFTPLFHPTKYYGIGAHIGSNVGFCHLQKDKVKMFKDTFDLERYFYWKAMVALNNRFVFVQPKEGANLRPCFLDLSIGYNLPIIYRYSGSKKESKRVSRYITNFNDFAAMARLGFGFLSFTAEYRLTDYIKTVFPNVPPLMFGLDFIIPND